MKSEPLRFKIPALLLVVSLCQHIATASSLCQQGLTILPFMLKTAAVVQPENNTASVLCAQFLGALITFKIASLQFSEYRPEERRRLVLLYGSILHIVQTRQREVK
jgi:hypothetical protein